MEACAHLSLTDLRCYHTTLDATANILGGCAKDMIIIIFVFFVLWRDNGEVIRVVIVDLHYQLAPGCHNKTIQVVWYPLQRGSKTFPEWKSETFSRMNSAAFVETKCKRGNCFPCSLLKIPKCGHCLTCGLFVIYAKNSQLIKINSTIQCNMPPPLSWPGIVQDATSGNTYYDHRSIGTQQLFLFLKTHLSLPILNFYVKK